MTRRPVIPVRPPPKPLAERLQGRDRVALLQQGLKAHREGRLQDALRSYRQLLDIDPEHLDALRLSGLATMHSGDPAAALTLFDRAMRVDARNAALLNDRGVALQLLGRLEEAVASHGQAAEIKPDFAEACFNRGNALAMMERHQEALASYEAAIRIRPGYAEAIGNRCTVLQRLGRLEEALAGYAEAIRLKPDYADAHSNRGVTLRTLDRLEEALASYEEAIRVRPGHADAIFNRGNAFLDLRRYDEAIASFDEAIRLKPGNAAAFYNRGNALHSLHRCEEAIASFGEAIRVKPDYAEAFNNRGVTLQELRRFDEASVDFAQAIRLKPGYEDPFANRGRMRLSLRQFAGGFDDYRRRFDETGRSSDRQPTTLPVCGPGTLRGRLLLWAEQGIGDEVFFAGLLPALLKREVSVTLTADKRLHALLARSLPQVRLLDRAVTIRSSIDDGHDAQAPIGDLGYLLGMDEAAIAASRAVYLKADERRCAEMRAKLAALGGGRRVCGIAWRSANRKFSEAKSIDLAKLRPLLETRDTVFVNLQYGAVDAELEALHAKTGLRIHRIEGLDIREDIDGLTALIDACDTVVTSSNVTAHLAGAIGKRTAVLVPNSKGRLWYWHEGEERSLWYPSLRLFCQDDPVDWSRPIEACARWFRDPASTLG
jgi:tetratricopeptide (TPR) repeat protein